MKKLLGLVFMLSLMGFSYTSAANKTFESNVLKVNVYRSMASDDFIRAEQLGSSVYLGQGKLITNAHVILDSKTNEPFDTIEICGSIKKGTELKCGYTAKVVSYDPDIDLALLSLDQSIVLSGVKLADTDPSTGDPMIIKGYPRDGYATLTQTQGTVGGVYNQYYKIDASINGGNSGGGSFNKKFALVGIPTFKAAGYDANIGYIIPISMIKQFLNGQGNIIKHTSVKNPKFAPYIQQINSIKNQTTIGGQDFSFTLPAGFKIDDVNIADGLFNYKIINQKSNVNVYIDNRQIRGTGNLDKEIHNVYELFKNNVDKVATGTLTNKSTVWTGLTADDKGQGQSIYGTIVGNNLFGISIQGDTKNNDFKNANTWYKNISFKQLGKKALDKTIIWKNLVFAPSPLITFSKQIDMKYDYVSPGYDIILKLDVSGAKKNISAEDELYTTSASINEIQDGELVDKTAEELLGIETYNVDADTLRGLVSNKAGSVFYINKYKDDNGDYLVEVLGLTTIGTKRYRYTLNFNAGNSNTLASSILTYLNDSFKVIGDNSFVEWSVDPITLADLIAGKKSSTSKTIDTSKVSFYDYTNYTEKKLSWDARYRLNESNKQGNSYIKIIDLKTSYTPGSEYPIKWYGENLKSVSIYLLSEDGTITQKYNIAVNKDNPSGLYYLTIPKNARGPLLLNIDGTTQKDQSISDYSDTLISQE